MSSAAECQSCRGKFPLLGEGAVECEVCGNFHRLRNLVWGGRFPSELRVTASRCLHSCYLQLLQEADAFYFQQPTAGTQVDASQPKVPEPVRRSPVAAVKKEKDKERRKKDKKRRGDRSRSPGGERRKKVKEEDQVDHRDAAETAKKERKPSRREEDDRRSPPTRRVKEESPEKEKEALAHVKAEETGEEEGYESETITEDEGSRSKSPLVRRRAPLSPVRPRSPPDPPPAPAQGRAPLERPPHRQAWVGPIPAGVARGREDTGEESPRGLAPKYKPAHPEKKKKKKSKKNKGIKHRERQERRRRDRAQGGR